MHLTNIRNKVMNKMFKLHKMQTIRRLAYHININKHKHQTKKTFSMEFLKFIKSFMRQVGIWESFSRQNLFLDFFLAYIGELSFC